jgi:hypothetical protein
MKKTNIFFMKLLIGIILLGFSGQSSAYDLSKWTSKPVEWAKHVAQWFGYGDKDENKPVSASPVIVVNTSDTQTKNEYTVTATNTRDMSGQINSDLYNYMETFGFSNEIPDYSIRVSGPFNNTTLDLYRWYGDTINPLGIKDNNFDSQTVSAFEQQLRYGIDEGTVAARFSYNLPFFNILHQGIEPSVNIESSYRLGSSQPSYSVSRLKDSTDYRWKTGISYKGKNLINLPVSPVAINWGIGYDYKVATDNYDALGNGYEAHDYHSGNIFAGSYWYNLKLYTMFMYLYDSKSGSGMTSLNATYSPSLRWTYGIRANFYSSKKEVNGKGININPELVSFTATYRWD